MNQKTYTINQDTVDTLRHIFKARGQNCKNLCARLAYKIALDLFDYALENRMEYLEQFDYYSLNEEEEK